MRTHYNLLLKCKGRIFGKFLGGMFYNNSRGAAIVSHVYFYPPKYSLRYIAPKGHFTRHLRTAHRTLWKTVNYNTTIHFCRHYDRCDFLSKKTFVKYIFLSKTSQPREFLWKEKTACMMMTGGVDNVITLETKGLFSHYIYAYAWKCQAMQEALLQWTLNL